MVDRMIVASLTILSFLGGMTSPSKAQTQEEYPGVAVETSCGTSQPVCTDEAIIFTVKITNIGAITLSRCVVEADGCWPPSTDFYSIAPGASIESSCGTDAPQNSPREIHASVICTNDYGAVIAEANATPSTCTIPLCPRPTFTVEASCDDTQQVCGDEVIIFTVKITNTGPYPIECAGPGYMCFGPDTGYRGVNPGESIAPTCAVVQAQNLPALIAPTVACWDKWGQVTGGGAQSNACTIPLCPVSSTPAGANVNVDFFDPSSGAQFPVTVTFDTVATSGSTTLTTASAFEWLPSGFKLGNPATSYDISTTAVYSGLVHVCINYAGMSFGNEANLRLVHKADGSTVWEDITDPGYPNTADKTICGTTTSLSPFVPVEPIIDAINGPASPVPAGTTVAMSAPVYLEVSSAGSYVATWEWNDGHFQDTPLTADSSGYLKTTGLYAYSQAGVYTVILHIRKVADGNEVASRAFRYVVVFDPGAGFVTGGGWINSPPGAYTPDLSLSGKANFGFESKYQKGTSVPTGNTQFKFNVADMSFKSTSYQWLVIAGPQAKYKGEGTINGSGSYGFLLTAIDGQQNGEGGQDRFRIKIWDKASGQIVYDNQMGADDNSAASTAISGGSIVIHK